MLKIIHFPGGTGQRRQANYLILPGSTLTPGVVYDTKIVFVEDKNDPSKFDPGWETVMSKDSDSSIIPDYLVNKVLVQELSGCRLDFIEVFFVTEPSHSSRLEVYQWDFTVDRDNPIGNDPFRTTLRIHQSLWDWIKAKLGIPGAVFETKGLTTRPKRAGIYSVKVAIDKPKLVGDARLEILAALDLALKVVE
jgi:hypothetical protein